MSTSLLGLPLSSPIPGPNKRKRVLLVDASPAKRELRAEAMRKLGMDVDCACDISEARSWWRADLYNLVLINLGNDLGHRDKFCEDIRAAKPPQHTAYFVGKPEYLAESPSLPDASSPQEGSDIELGDETKTSQASDTTGGPVLPWGIMEASRRISAVRSVSAARSTAMRNRPSPPRDLEVKASRRAELMSQLASELQKEELL
jgi:CheY-like chemotaxis protein